MDLLSPHGDLAILAPPWGGPAYTAPGPFDLRTGFPSGDGVDLVAKVGVWGVCVWAC